MQGDPGDGKSTFMLTIAALLTRGEPLPFTDTGKPHEPISVIYQTTEDDADDTIVPRFIKANGDRERLLFISEKESPLTFGMGAVLLGCLTGTLLSGVITTFVMRTLTETAQFQFGFYPDTVGLIVLFFCTAFLFVGMADSRKISKIKLIDLLNEKKNGESQNTKKKQNFLSVLITIVSFGITGRNDSQSGGAGGLS